MSSYIDLHTHSAATDCLSIRNIRIESAAPQIPTTGYFSAGIHPWDAADAQPAWERFFEHPSPRLLAIGETGLDFRPEHRPYEAQEEWFGRQIEISNRLHKPLIIHAVHATDTVMKRLRQTAQEPAVLHGFIGSKESAAQWITHLPTLRFSFGPSTFRSPKTQQALEYVAREWPERLFLETDDHPTVSIPEMYNLAGELTGRELPLLQEQIRHNFHLLFPQIPLE